MCFVGMRNEKPYCIFKHTQNFHQSKQSSGGTKLTLAKILGEGRKIQQTAAEAKAVNGDGDSAPKTVSVYPTSV